MSRYAVKELFRTLQGEGANTGRVAVFCRFAGCNLWSGRPEDRSEAKADCGHWCDTDFRGTDGKGGGRYQDASLLADAAWRAWGHAPKHGQVPLVVCTGGEPLLQLDEELVAAFHAVGFQVAIETNGTLPVPKGVDWVCVSPKAGSTLVVKGGDELKLIYPQAGSNPENFCRLDFTHFILQPKDGPDRDEALSGVHAYCLEHPQWRLGLQSHKVLGIP